MIKLVIFTVAVVAAVFVFLALDGLARGQSGGGPAIDWEQDKLSVEIMQGRKWEIPAEFSSSHTLSDVSVRIVPEISGLVSSEPETLENIESGEDKTLNLTLEIPIDTVPGEYEGTLHLRRGKAIIAKPLPIEISVVAHPGEETSSLSLRPGGLVEGPDQVTVGAPEGNLESGIDLELSRINDPDEIPLPNYLEHLNVVGSYYSLSAEEDLLLREDNYLAFGLPVPQGLPTDDLAVIALSPPDSVRGAVAFDPSLGHDESDRWSISRGSFDADSNLFGTILPSVRSEKVVYALVQKADFEEPQPPENLNFSPAQVDSEFVGFQVECVGFNPGECTEDHRELTEDALNEAYDRWVGELGFNEPHLKHVVAGVDFFNNQADITILNKYEYQLEKANNPNGAFNPYQKEAATKYPGAPAQPNPITARHESFHAIQYGYPNTLANVNDWVFAVDEGAAAAAELSLDSLKRSSRNLPGRAPRHVNIGLFRHDGNDQNASTDANDYAVQDFWTFLGMKIREDDPQINFLIPLFERGSSRDDIADLLREGQTFDDFGHAYWSWAKNQTFEKETILGQDSNGADVPNGPVCEWSGHSGLELVVIDPDDVDKATREFELEPLQSKVFEIALPPEEDDYAALASVEAANDPDGDMQAKFYLEDEAGTNDCRARADNPEKAIQSGDDEVKAYALVSNTDYQNDLSDIKLEFEIADLEIAELDDQEVDEDFDVVLALTDGNGDPMPAPENSDIELSVVQGSGNLNGELTATLEEGESELVFEGVSYDTDEEDVILRAESVGGFAEGIGTESNPFKVEGNSELDVYILGYTESFNLIEPETEAARTVVNGLSGSLDGYSDIRYAVGDVMDFQSPDQTFPYAFNPALPFSEDNRHSALNAINNWEYPGFGDHDLAGAHHYAYDQIGRDRAPSHTGGEAGTIGWREDSEKLLIYFSNTPAHERTCPAITYNVPGHGIDYYLTEYSARSSLASSGIRFIGVNIDTVLSRHMDGWAYTYLYEDACGWGFPSMNPQGQATRMANGTGGLFIDSPTRDGVETGQLVLDEVAELLNQ